MFSKKSGIKEGRFDTFIGSNTQFEGLLKSEGTIRIDGCIKGELQIKGDVFIGEESNIVGNITAFNVVVAGEAHGNITTTEQLKIISSGKVFGDIAVKSFVVEENGRLDGNCKMISVDISKEQNTEKKKTLQKGNKQSEVE